MKFKKIMSTALAGALALSMGATAFASSTVTDLTEGAELEVTGSTQGATINLTVPSSAAIVVNPYKMDVKVSDTSTVKTQIVSPVYFIENNSSLAIKVDIKATGVTEGDAKLVAEADLTKDDAKNAYVYMAYEAVADTTATTVADTNKVVLSTAAVTGSQTLAATDGTAGTAKDVLAFKFDGKANEKAATPWTAEDTVSATIAFTFTVDNT